MFKIKKHLLISWEIVCQVWHSLSKSLRITAAKINKVFWHYVNLILLTFVAIALDISIVIFGPAAYDTYFGKLATDRKVHKIYKEIIVASGQADNVAELVIVEKNINNAYADGKRIVLYRGLINASTWDGIAWTLGHELAHHQLQHPGSGSTKEQRKRNEAVADKLAAVYMMKAGYNICVAREEWKQFKDQLGNSLGGVHPSHSYRYDELNINCD